MHKNKHPSGGISFFACIYIQKKNGMKNKQYIIKKLFHTGLKPAERIILNETDSLDALLKELWKEAAEQPADAEQGRRIWAQIMSRIGSGRAMRRKRAMYRYSMAGMIAICLFLSALLFTGKSETAVVYIVHTGRQSVDSVRLSDGTKVILGANSKLTYPDRFSRNERRVELTGQAFFEVKGNKEHPFVVHTRQMTVTVSGTSFEVSDYDTDKQAEVVLMEGKVEVGLADKRYELHPNEKLTCKEGAHPVLRRVNAALHTSWRDGKQIRFADAPLSDILGKLEKWYGQEIKCDKEVAERYRFTFTLHNESLELILNYFSHTAPLDYKLINSDCYMIMERKN